MGRSWLVALVITCALAVPSPPAVAPPARSRPEAGLALPRSPWPAVRRGLVVVWVVVERGVDAFVDRFIDGHIEDTRPMIEKLAALGARKRILERRLVELKRQIAERERHRCGQWYAPNPSAMSALDVMRGR